MKLKVTFHLEDVWSRIPSHFTKWLEDYVRERPFSHPSQEYQFKLWMRSPAHHDWEHWIDAWKHIGGGRYEQQPYLERAITFRLSGELFEPATVRAECMMREAEITAYFARLLEAIALDFPEAAGEIREGLEEVEQEAKTGEADEERQGGHPVEPQKPVEPKGKKLDEWFEYYYEMQRRSFKFTLKDIADKTTYNYGYVRQKKREYDAEHGDSET